MAQDEHTARGASDFEIVEALRRHRERAGQRAPRIALFLFECADPETLQRTLARIPALVDDWLEEVVVMLQRNNTQLPPFGELAAARDFVLRFHRDPRESGTGGARKAAFEYALRSGFEHAILLRGGGVHPPEALPRLLQAVLDDGDRLIVASRLVERIATYRAGMSLRRVLAHAFATGFQNRLLALRLRDYHSSYRVYPMRALARIPFQLNASDRAFDIEILIQLRSLGVPIVEEPVLPAWREDPASSGELAHVLRAWRTAIGYRLHQLHVTRDGRYLLDRGTHYTLKQSPTGSHMQIVDAISTGSRVLDLGCSQGLLARPLRAKGVLLTGVDSRAPEGLAAELEAYHQRDLEAPLELPEGRVFDYVVCADVIEHLRNRQQLLRTVRRFLKEDGLLVISTPNVALWFYRLSLLVGRFEYGPRGVLDHTHVHLYTRATFRRELEKAGFRVLREHVTALPFEVVFESTGRSRLLRAVAKVYHALARVWPAMFAYQILFEAEITTLDEDATNRHESAAADGHRGGEC